tara:strand:+ start:179 stop:568 length:390 start_codon:yes stop_codon:yes gene_type:complete
MGITLFILILLVSFNRTINRLTKPVTALLIISLLSSAIISSFNYFKKIEGELFLSNYLKFFESTNLVLHLSELSERIIILFSLIMTVLIGTFFYKLPRQKGYVALMVAIGLISSSIIFTILLIDFSNFI